MKTPIEIYEKHCWRSVNLIESVGPSPLTLLKVTCVTLLKVAIL